MPFINKLIDLILSLVNQQPENNNNNNGNILWLLQLRYAGGMPLKYN